MPHKKNIIAISGSTRESSVNELILKWLGERYSDRLSVTLYDRIAELPHFRSDLAGDLAPEDVKALHKLIAVADGVIICTPEYVFSLPGSLKNALEWTVATTLFTDKPTALIVASTLGEKAFESLHLVMTTLGAKIHPEAELLIPAVKAKFNAQGKLTDDKLLPAFDKLVAGFIASMDEANT
jgi:chromate reductase